MSSRKLKPCMLLIALVAASIVSAPGWTADAQQETASPASVASATPAGDTQARDLFYTPSSPGSGPSLTQPAPQPVPPPPPPLPQQGIIPVPPPPPVNPVLVPVAPVIPVVPVIGLPPLGLRYRILLKDGDNIRQVNTLSFRSGQRIRLLLSSNMHGYLYIVMHGSKGTRTLLFPSPMIDGGNNFVSPFQEFEVPSDGWFALDETTGKETLDVFLSPTPLPEFEGIAAAGSILAPPQWARIEGLIARQKQGLSRSLQFNDGGAPPPPPPGVAPLPYVVGHIPSIYVVQYAPLLFERIEILHYR